jgi:hypothetical protein
MDPIPQCQYVIRKGEAPDPGRANILPWSPAVALRPDKWEPFLGALPPLPAKPGDTAPEPKQPPMPEDVSRSLRALAILTAIDHLESGEFTAAGLPKLDALRTLTGFDVATSERDEAWARHKAKTRPT